MVWKGDLDGFCTNQRLHWRRTNVNPTEHIESAVRMPHAHAGVALRVEGAAKYILCHNQNV